MQVKDRIKELFPLIDTNGDHFLDEAELRAWTLNNGTGSRCCELQQAAAFACTSMRLVVLASSAQVSLLPLHMPAGMANTQQRCHKRLCHRNARPCECAWLQPGSK